ncbi:MAG: hypothetical protein GY765_35125 [bacterium]|nr:hypothetical protein [bacterium]
MTEATIRIPGNIDIKKVSDEIVYKAFSIAIEKKKKELKKELRQVESKIKRFEKKHKMSYQEYETSMGDGFQHHNDWMDWSFLVESRQLLVEELENFEIR